MKIRGVAIVLVAAAAVAGVADSSPTTTGSEPNPAQPVARSYQAIGFGQPCPADGAVGIDYSGRIFHCGAWFDGHTLRWDD